MDILGIRAAIGTKSITDLPLRACARIREERDTSIMESSLEKMSVFAKNCHS